MYCDKCKISLTGKHMKCPLCQGDLTGEGSPQENTFPVLPDKYTGRSVLSWVAFAAIATMAITIAINLTFPQGGWWSLFVVGGIASFWLALNIAIKKRHNIPKSIVWMVVIVSVLAIIWDYFTGFYRWSINFVLPILSTCALIAMAVASKLLKLKIDDYMIYLMIDSIFGFVSLALILLGSLTVVYPSAICFAGSVISLALLVTLEGKGMFAEIQRRMHI